MKLSISIIGLLLFITSCEKVIDLKLNNAAQKYVIEGNITDEAGNCAVKITQTKDFDQNNDFPGVSGATVTISDNGGAAITLDEKSTGVYETTAITGTTGHVYTLTVVVGGQTFTAASTMPVLVPFDSLYISELQLGGDTRKLATVAYQDPLGLGNGYHFIQFKNGVQEKTVFASNDEFSDGRAITQNLLTFNNNNNDDDKKIKSGDSVRVVMECVDPAVYTYWHSIDAATGESNSATPANPVTNIVGGALGYFSVHTVQQKSIVAP